MAASLGYQCEFLDPVSDDLYCKKCTLVARKLSISTCCGESFCQSCIADTQKEGKPCPVCGEKDYNIVGRVKTQKRINCLRVYCSMKERGCGWSGTLEQLIDIRTVKGLETHHVRRIESNVRRLFPFILGAFRP